MEPEVGLDSCVSLSTQDILSLYDCNFFSLTMSLKFVGGCECSECFYS